MSCSSEAAPDVECFFDGVDSNPVIQSSSKDLFLKRFLGGCMKVGDITTAATTFSHCDAQNPQDNIETALDNFICGANHTTSRTIDNTMSFFISMDNSNNHVESASFIQLIKTKYMLESQQADPHYEEWQKDFQQSNPILQPPGAVVTSPSLGHISMLDDDNVDIDAVEDLNCPATVSWRFDTEIKDVDLKIDNFIVDVDDDCGGYFPSMGFKERAQESMDVTLAVHDIEEEEEEHVERVDGIETLCFDSDGDDGMEDEVLDNTPFNIIEAFKLASLLQKDSSKFVNIVDDLVQTYEPESF